MGLQPRDHQVMCAWCPRMTWALSGVCRSRRCRDLDARMKLRRESFRQDPRGGGLSAAGPVPGANASHTALTVPAGAATSAGEGSGASASSIAAPPSPAVLEGERS